MPKEVKLYNTLSRSVEIFSPLEPGQVKLYCCGPTVYNYQHVGNLRTYLFEDVLVRMLRYAGYQVNHVMNITDVGHLVSDGDDGEDKMMVAARREKKKSAELADFYSNIFFQHCDMLGITRPSIICKATDHIPQMIALIEKLIKQGAAYQSGGNIYFDVTQFPTYGALARLDLQKLQSGARIEVDSQKRQPLDFALWFTKSKFENQELQWDSPWGRGYPGWHIECSAMAMHYLGETFDIHCGGIDHIPVHHTNEIAQSEAATGKSFVRFWLHGGFLLTEQEKMSKSAGTFLTLDALSAKGFDPIAYRLFCLGGHYRKELAFHWEALEGAAQTLKKLKTQILQLKQEIDPASSTILNKITKPQLKAHQQQFDEAILADLGTAKALATLYAVLSDGQLTANEKYALAVEFDSILGLGFSTWQQETLQIPAAISQLLTQREEARQRKNWSESDRLRDDIMKQGYLVEDSKEGQKLKKL